VEEVGEAVDLDAQVRPRRGAAARPPAALELEVEADLHPAVQQRLGVAELAVHHGADRVHRPSLDRGEDPLVVGGPVAVVVGGDDQAASAVAVLHPPNDGERVLSRGDDEPVPQVVHHRYGVVLGLILVTLAFQLAAPEGDVARMVAVTLQGATLVAAVIIANAHRWVVRMTIAACVLLVAVAAGALFGTEEFGADSAHVISLLLVGLAPPVIVLGLREHFHQEGGMTLQTMFGVLCIYLLIGMLFGSLYGVIDSYTEQKFFISEEKLNISDFLYFSFTTLTTTGYGDLVAATDVGRSLAITETLIGQIYLVTVVALIVSQVGLRRASRDA
jgi:hypothetical protein